MALSLFEKARISVLGQLHTLLDKSVNTIDGYKQFIRDLENALADLQAAHDEAVGTISGYKRDITNLEADNVRKQADIDLLLGDDDEANDKSALNLQLEHDANTEQIAQLQELVATAEGNKALLDEAVDKLQTKHRQMLNNLTQLTLSVAATKAQDRASGAAEAALEASSAAGEAGIDNLAATLDHKKDVSDARFARVIGGLQSESSPEEEAKLARAKIALEDRRAVITAKAKEGAPTPTTS